MPLFNIVAKKLKASEYVVQKVEDGKALRSVLPHISKKLGIPSMKNYVVFACNEKRQPIARLDMDIPLEEQGVKPLSFLYVSPCDATPKGPDGEELPLASDLQRIEQQKEKEEEKEDSTPPPPPLEEKEKEEEPKTTANDSTEEESKIAETKTTAEEPKTVTTKSTEEETKAATAKSPVVHFSDDAAGSVGNQSLDMESNNGHNRREKTHSTGAEHRVHIDPVPDIADIIETEEAPNDVQRRVSDVMVFQLAAVANEHPVQHAVLLRLASMVLNKRPNNPLTFLFSHLQSKHGLDTVVQPQKKEACRRSPSATPTFAPVGDTAEERLVSVAPAGLLRTTMRLWAKLLLETKPDNPVEFMWSKLEANMDRDTLGMSLSRMSGTATMEDSIKLSLLRGVPRGSHSYTVLRNLVDRTLEKKPDQPEMWMLNYYLARNRSSASASVRSPPLLPSRSIEDICREDVSCSSNGEEPFIAMDACMPRATSMLSNHWMDCILPPPSTTSLKSGTHPRTREASTQTSYIFQEREVANTARVDSVLRETNALPVSATCFLCNRSPRELLQPPLYDPALILHHHHRSLFHEKYSPFCDPLRCSKGLSLRHGNHSPRNYTHPSEPSDRNPSGCVGNDEERPDVNREGRTQVISLPLCESLSPQQPSTSFLPSRDEYSELQYALRRRETERAEAIYEYNWLLQREAVRKEYLHKELELLRYERDIRERLMQRSPNAYMTVPVQSSASPQVEAEALLHDSRQQGFSQPPSELDVIRKRLELLDMEEARYRHLSRTPHHSAVPTRKDVIGDAALHATYDSPALYRSNDRVGISPHFKSVP